MKQWSSVTPQEILILQTMGDERPEGAPMKRESAIDLKNKLTEEMRLLGFSLPRDPAEEVAATAPIPVGLGLRGGARGEWLLAFRLYADDWTPEMRALLATIRKRARGELDSKIVAPPMLHSGLKLRSSNRIGTTNERWGTLGWFVTLAGREDAGPQALTCAHVIARSGAASVDDLVVIPPAPDAELPTHEVVGMVSSVAPVSPPWKHMGVDAATIQPSSGVEIDLNVGSRGPVRDVVDLTQEEVVVVKHGGTTDMTLGATSAQLLPVPMRDPLTGALSVYVDQIEIESTDPSGRFSAPGDSGSLVLEPRSHLGVGMLNGGSGEYSYLTPLNTVLTALGAKPA
jgi:hypothetical protein